MQYLVLSQLDVKLPSIKQMIDGSLNHFWKISYGQIYPTLKLLVDKGYASFQAKTQEGKPDKIEYYITPEGERTLKLWLQQPIQQLPTEKNELLLKLFFSRHQDLPTTLHHLDTYYEKLISRHRTYQGVKEMITTCLIDQEDAPFWIITIDYGLRVSQAAIDWCKDTKKSLLKQKED
ncbi:PadR family transcriptional regulator [Peribacillus frigoritolerans]|uniref:PadR family transcriptional regulator n=1 Tax=Peribacillus frigoritolerans TaxID=450367 RepID=UPI00315D1961